MYCYNLLIFNITIRLKYLNLNLFKKTVIIINSISNLNIIKKNFVYLIYNQSKTVKRFNLKVFSNFPRILNILKEDIFKVKFKFYNKQPIKLFIINCKLQFRWMILLSNH